MWRKTLYVTIVLVICLVPAVSAQLASVTSNAETLCGETGEVQAGFPFGHFDGNPKGDLNGAAGILPVHGWALDNDGIARVDIMVDGRVVAEARYGSLRPDVNRIFPGFPDSPAAGFSYDLDTTQFLNGPHSIGAMAVSESGQRTQLNSHQFFFSNNTHNLRPFGQIGFPNNQAELSGRCDLTDPDRRYSVIYGWALDAGVELDDHGVGYVELLLDGALILSSRLDCQHNPITGAYTNCYGLRRDDIEARYKTLKDATHAGFRFVLDVGQLLSFGYAPGHHRLTVRVGDVDSQVSNIDSISVNFACDDFFANEDAFGDFHTEEGPSSSIGLLTGWALDREGVGQVRILIDGEFVGTATYGFTRPLITSLYPGFFNSAAPGWLFPLDTVVLADGEHVVQVVVRDGQGVESVIGELRFVSNNG